MPKESAKKVVASKQTEPATAAKKVPAATKVAAKTVKATPATTALAVKPVATKAVAPVKPVVATKAAPAVSTTTIVVSYDAGFGNSLFLRGEGQGLSWEKGVELKNITAEEWVYSIEGASASLAVKVLLNDTLWSAGANVEVPAGQKTVITPVF